MHPVNDQNRTMHQVNDQNKTMHQVNDQNKTMHPVNDQNKTMHQVNDQNKTMHQVNDQNKTMHQVNDQNNMASSTSMQTQVLCGMRMHHVFVAILSVFVLVSELVMNPLPVASTDNIQIGRRLASILLVVITIFTSIHGAIKEEKLKRRLARHEAFSKLTILQRHIEENIVRRGAWSSDLQARQLALDRDTAALKDAADNLKARETQMTANIALLQADHKAIADLAQKAHKADSLSKDLSNCQKARTAEQRIAKVMQSRAKVVTGRLEQEKSSCWTQIREGEQEIRRLKRACDEQERESEGQLRELRLQLSEAEAQGETYRVEAERSEVQIVPLQIRVAEANNQLFAALEEIHQAREQARRSDGQIVLLQGQLSQMGSLGRELENEKVKARNAELLLAGAKQEIEKLSRELAAAKLSEPEPEVMLRPSQSASRKEEVVVEEGEEGDEDDGWETESSEDNPLADLEACARVTAKS